MEPDTTVNEHFKSQFKALQEHQQRRLQNLMERKKGKQNSRKGNSGKAEETFGSQNDLNLFEVGQPENDDVRKRLLEAENEQLQDQLREVRDENGRLYKLVREKDFEIKQLQKKIQEDKLALSGTSGLAGDIAATKIVELAKKNREITAETESEKAKVKQLNNKVKELERELQTAMGKIHSLGGGDSGIKQSTLKMIEGNLAESPEVKALQEKLTTANFKVMEYRNQLQSTKQELKMTQKLLANEVGEDVNVQSLLATSGSWRGRAQQILVLQGKVRELESRLCQTKSRTSSTEIDDDLLALTDPRKLSAQEKNLLKIRSLEKEKKEALEKLTGERDALQKDHEEVKKKLDASKARNKVLCSEVKTLKGQIVTLLEKGKHDDELIDALLSQQKQMQEILMHLSQQDEKNKESQQILGQHLNSEAQKQNCLIEQLKQMVAEREAKVKELEEEIGQLTLQNKSAHQGDSSGAADIPPFERSEDTSFTLLRTLASGSDQVGRTESVRVEESSDKVLEVEKKLQEERRRCVILEQQIEKLKMDPGKNTGAQKPSLRSKAGQSTSHSRLTWNVSDKELSAAQLSKLPLESQIQELSTRLVIQLDENEALKAALETAVRMKEEDFKLFQDTMDQVKEIFLQALRQQKQEKN
ncbi:coiled-coil domain-containing protein 13 isoform X5 [Struthio camelus]|uniref:coiled-coil domain-containing protein 13 isoform X5 n=1 Tax=Struthio camelus TaxID=8801 RepID=UPI0036040817